MLLCRRLKYNLVVPEDKKARVTKVGCTQCRAIQYNHTCCARALHENKRQLKLEQFRVDGSLDIKLMDLCICLPVRGCQYCLRGV